MIIPDNIKKLMSAADRESLDKGDISWEEALARGRVKNEAELQRLIVSWLKSSRGVNWVIWSRTDKPTTNAKGTPDICFVYNARNKGKYVGNYNAFFAVAWEVKLAGKDLDPNQISARTGMMLDGWKCATIHGLTEAKEFLDKL